NPGVYIMYLVDAEGLGPSWNEWIPELKMLELYASSGVEAEDTAMQIDLIRHKAKRNKHFFERRKYLLTDSDVKKVVVVCDAAVVSNPVVISDAAVVVVSDAAIICDAAVISHVAVNIRAIRLHAHTHRTYELE
ncbi:hypothetical protein V501_09209, partial [Pseudogymnoascus sp. VKM F-4519 (FW-2642)]